MNTEATVQQRAQDKSVPEGFESQRPGGNFAFQNSKNWSGIDQTGRMVRGIFIGLTEPNKYGKRDYIFKALEGGFSVDKEGNMKEYPAGTQVTVNTSGSLTTQMEKAQLGDEIIIDYDGKDKIRKGQWKGSIAYNFTVYIKPGNGAVVDAVQTAAPSSTSADMKAKLSKLASKAN